MKHPLHRLSKKTRNVISGFMVGVATLVLVAYYLDLPGNLLLRHFLASLVFVVLIIVLAIIAIVVVKTLAALFRRLSGERDDGEDSSHRNRRESGGRGP